MNQSHENPEQLGSEATNLAIEALTALNNTELLARIGGKLKYLDTLDAQVSKDVITFLSESESESLTTNEETKQLCQVALYASGRRIIRLNHSRIWLPMDVWAISQSDMEYWDIPDNYKPFIEDIRHVRLFDKNSITHLCSTQGSYWMWHVDTVVQYADDASDEMKDTIDNWLRENDTNDNDYAHESDINCLIERNEPFTVHHIGNPGISWDDVDGEDEQKENNILEAVRERWQANPQF